MSVRLDINDIKKVYEQNEGARSWQSLIKKQKPGKPFTALNGLSVSVKAGSFTTIFGPNGSGKSTLFRLIAGLDEPTKGSIEIDGQSAATARIGFVFQNYRDSMLTWRTAIGNVRLALEARKVPPADHEKIAMNYLKKVGMGHVANKPFYSLSGGQAQLVSIARAFAYEPDILLMDEPFSALDFQTSLQMMQALLKLWEETGITTLFISHDIDEAVYLADQVMVLTKNPGKLQKMVDVKLPRPRSISMLTDPAFFKIRSRVLKEFEKGSK